MKKIASIALCLILAATAVGQAMMTAFATETPTITCQSKECNPGDSITVDVTITNNPGITYLELTPVCSEELGTPTVNNGSLFSITKGKNLVFDADEDVSENGKLVSFSFTVGEAVAPGSYSVGFTFRSAFNYEETPVSFTVVPATVTVKAKPVPVTGVSLDKTTATVKTGKTVTLTPVFAPDTATNKNVTWTSSNETVATVANGVVSGIKVGTATITVKTEDGNFKATCAVTVECSHANTTVHPAENSTCLKQGHAEYYTCDACGIVTSGSDALLPLADHNYGAWIPEKPATHTADGVKGHYHCSVCKKDFDSAKKELPSLVITKDAGHGTPATVWKSDATYHWHECKVEGCGVVIDSTKATHTFEWKTDTAATEDAAGVKHEECSVCGYKRNENTPIPKLDHTHTGITHHDAKAATCKETGNVEYWTCSSSKCSGKYYSDKDCKNEITTGITLSKNNNHIGGTEYRNSKPTTCYEAGYEGDIYCLGCGAKIGTGKSITKLSHTPSGWKSDANYHWKNCTVAACGAVIDGTKATHTFEWKVDKAATEDETGVKHEECSACGYKRSEGTMINKLDHVHTPVYYGAVAGSCKAKGNIEYWTCTSPKCAGKYYSEETCTLTVESVELDVDENNHLHTEIRNKKDVTCTEDGYTGDTYCTDCGKKTKDGEAIKATGHTYKNGKCKICGAKDPDHTPASPKMGDNNSMALWLVLASVSLLGGFTLIFAKKRKTVR